MAQNHNRPIVGVDDLAEGDHQVLGFCAVSIDRGQLAKLDATAKPVFHKYRISEFHGNEFSANLEQAYNDFLAALAIAILDSHDGRALVRFQSSNKFRENLSFGENYFQRTLLPMLGNSKQSLRNALGKCSGWLTLLVHNWTDIAPGAVMVDIEMDSDESKRRLKDVGMLGSTPKSGEEIMSIWHNALRDVFVQKGMSVPRLRQFTIADSKTSLIAQAADVLGNFVLSDLRSMLGYTPRSAERKIALLRNHFGPSTVNNISGWTCENGKLRPGASATDFVLRVSS